MSDRDYMYAGRDADPDAAENLQAAGKAPIEAEGGQADNLDEVVEAQDAVFDPTAALTNLGMAVPQPVEVEDDEGFGSASLVGAEPLDLSAFATVEGTEARERDLADDLAQLGAAAFNNQPTPQGFGPTPDPKPAGNPKDLIGASKPDLSLVPPAGMLYEAQAMMDGARKYGPYNWRSNPVLMRVYIAAAMRHLQQLLDGEDFDPTSGVHHLGHARACLGILSDARETGNLIDDRPPEGPSGAMIRRFGDTGSYRK